MSLQEQLNDAMKEAMRAKDSLRLNTIRMIRTAVKNVEIDQRRSLEDAEIIAVMATLVKQRRESAQMYRDNGRTDLAEKEEQEIAVVQQFLPQPLTDAELTALIEQTVTELGASSLKDLGAVMKVLSEATRGRAEGRVVSERVRARLGA
ncbi:MAG: GatB/YqeY domain-containing protein [Desulfuromonas thiophila]|jgi:uncharacterized protein YqeY|nr:GatB/YqeY domain-containing protein [Desulfuromonas thiophila]MDD3801638.1 GatB/YqeY domain-containing protein [Desulfuromonas thiophila]MDY0397946.1 GatB/YqeY domain-containing protein [Desulfuromonas thiophila]